MNMKSIGFNSTCLLSPKSSKDREDLNSWWTRTGLHRGFKSRVNRPKPTVQEYFRAIREQQVITDYHIDRLGVGKTPSKKRIKRKISNNQLFHICSKYSDCSSKVDYLFEIAKYFGHEICM